MAPFAPAPAIVSKLISRSAPVVAATALQRAGHIDLGQAPLGRLHVEPVQKARHGRPRRADARQRWRRSSAGCFIAFGIRQGSRPAITSAPASTSSALARRGGRAVVDPHAAPHRRQHRRQHRWIMDRQGGGGGFGVGQADARQLVGLDEKGPAPRRAASAPWPASAAYGPRRRRAGSTASTGCPGCVISAASSPASARSAATSASFFAALRPARVSGQALAGAIGGPRTGRPRSHRRDCPTGRSVICRRARAPSSRATSAAVCSHGSWPTTPPLGSASASQSSSVVSGQGHRREDRCIGLRPHLHPVAPVDEDARHVRQHRGEPRRPGEARQPGQPLVAGRHVFPLRNGRFAAGTRKASSPVSPSRAAGRPPARPSWGRSRFEILETATAPFIFPEKLADGTPPTTPPDADPYAIAVATGTPRHKRNARAQLARFIPSSPAPGPADRCRRGWPVAR